jgi:putative ABC transport system permease protein
MGIISRGIKNAFRNGIRTASIIFILAVSVSMALVMLMSLKTVQAKITSVKSSIGNYLTISPAGVSGFEGGGTLLTTQNATDVTALPHVSKVTETLTDRLTTTDTNLVSSINPGSFGNRQAGRNGTSFTPPADSNSSRNDSSAGTAQRTFTMPVEVMSTSDLSVLSSLGVSQFKITSGSVFDAKSADNVAVLGSDLATKNNLSVGSTFTAYGATVKVVGIYDTGTTFTNSSVVMPIKTLQTLSSQADQYNSFIVQADSIDTMATVKTSITNKLGSSTVDVVSQADSAASAIAPLQNIKTISLYSLIGSLVAGSIIILLTMIMIVRERRREIGVLKAIGSSNIGVMAMFTVEALVLTLISSVIGAVLGLIFSNPVLNVLVTNSTSSTSTSAQGGGAGRAMMRFGGQAFGGAQNAVRNLHAVVGWEILLYGLLAAVVIAIIGSALPAFFIAKIRPAEVMRQE